MRRDFDREGKRAADKYMGMDKNYYVEGYNNRSDKGNETKYRSLKPNQSKKECEKEQKQRRARNI